jgi:hypothetical protein
MILSNDRITLAVQYSQVQNMWLAKHRTEKDKCNIDSMISYEYQFHQSRYKHRRNMYSNPHMAYMNYLKTLNEK